MAVGILTVCVTAAGAATPSTSERPRRLDVEVVRAAEQRLEDLGYWTGPVDGTWDRSSRQALVAFEKVEGRRRTGVLTVEETTALDAASPPVPRETGEAHIEVDLGRQILFFVDAGGAVSRILPISSGSEKPYLATSGRTARAHTPRGRFTIERKVAGWRVGPLGPMHYPNYFLGGFAIHGSSSVPPQPASHGCVRVPLFASKSLSELARIGMPVLVYD